PNYEMPSLYRECDIYVQPSIVEPYGIAVLEAMACGKPVIGAKVGGMRDTIKDGETGFLVEPGSPNELAEAILKMQDRKSTHIMGKKARIRVEYEFDWMKIAHDYIDLMETLK
ncbi:Glycosyltransferase involved in cell wall bisynthesis, partial [Candidatus Methanophagaceae archaeon]